MAEEVVPDDSALAGIGERIYHQGVLSNGQPLASVVRGALPGMDLACVRCHRRSGFGGREGGQLVPAVTGDYLFQNHLKVITRPALKRFRRWAYNEASFDRALRRGIDVMGGAISRVMPRYSLSSVDRAGLIAYLKTLVHRERPGIERDRVHIATIIDSRLPEAQRQAMAAVAEKFVEVKNRALNGAQRRATFSERQNNWNVKSFRRWKLHLWELKGEPDQWQQQLESYYLDQPVFVAVGGAVAGKWLPVARFCEDKALPCIFPHTDLPAVDQSSHFTFYFSEGLRLESEVLVSYLQSSTEPPKRVIQLYRDDQRGRYAAEGLRDLLGQVGLSVEDRAIPVASGFEDQHLIANELEQGDVVMLWLDHSSLQQLLNRLDGGKTAGHIYSSSSMQGDNLGPIESSWASRIQLIYPFKLPWQAPAGLSLGFLNKHGLLSKSHFRLQSETYTAFAAFGQVMKRVRHNLVREYLMEQLEHISDDLRATAIYPRFSLGPYQRIASKGAYLFPMSELAKEKHHDQYSWLIPDL